MVLGDGSFAFAHSVVDDLLQIPHTAVPAASSTSASPTDSSGSSGASAGAMLGATGQGIASGLRNRLGMLLNQSPPSQAVQATEAAATTSQQASSSPQHLYAQQVRSTGSSVAGGIGPSFQSYPLQPSYNIQPPPPPPQQQQQQQQQQPSYMPPPGSGPGSSPGSGRGSEAGSDDVR